MANIHEVNREASIQICVDSDVKSFGIFEFLTDRGVNVSQDLVAVQELTGKMWDITFKTVEAKRRVWPRICDADGCRVTSYNGSTTIVNVLFVPHELNDNVVRYILGRYGKVLCGRFKTYPNHPGVFNGIRQYQMELSKDIPSSLRIGGRNCWIRYGGQPRTCLKCGGDGHDARDCNQIICFKCQAPGHKSSECKAEASCTVCLKSGHIDLNCPLSFANIIKPTAAKWIAGAAEVVAQEVPPGDAKLLAENITEDAMEGTNEGTPLEHSEIDKGDPVTIAGNAGDTGSNFVPESADNDPTAVSLDDDTCSEMESDPLPLASIEEQGDSQGQPLDFSDEGIPPTPIKDWAEDGCGQMATSLPSEAERKAPHEARNKRKSFSQPEPSKRLDRSASQTRFPPEAPTDTIKMCQIFLEEEAWHSCRVKGCRINFSTFNDLLEHESSVHPSFKSKRYACALKNCKSLWDSPKEWINHIAVVHPSFVADRDVEFFDRYFLKVSK
ncbi:Zinc finger CCHC domain-containing protein 3 [Holothuria leucospilota]|uniref:Zinc finger CCHC domain-containing protein 3 n=1 Tax=Holothuria leucospilota TaxID=206669 RepID=A0A9Q1CA05_HOLLE|nr:Zinc finger CCHC domain-containing protein 3 [Holothuria leucospilota]